MARSPLSDPATIAMGFHALSDATRIEIVDMLRGGERCVCELMDALDAAQSRLSFHLRVLREAGLVTHRREGRWMYYTLNESALGGMEDFLTQLRTDSVITSSAREPVRAGCCD